MNYFKRISAVLFSVLMMLSILGLTSFSESIFNTAKEISSGKEVTGTIIHWEYSHDDKYNDYKITSTSSGKLVLSIKANQELFHVYVYDSDGNEILKSENDIKSGNSAKPFLSDYHWCTWNETTETFNGKLIYEIGKGTYYIRITQGQLYRSGNYIEGSGEFSLTATYPTTTSTKLTAPTIASAKLSVKVSWKKVTGATRYKLGYSTDKKKWSYVTTTSTNVSFPVTSGKTYYYRVRAENSSSTSSWTSIKSITVK